MLSAVYQTLLYIVLCNCLFKVILADYPVCLKSLTERIEKLGSGWSTVLKFVDLELPVIHVQYHAVTLYIICRKDKVTKVESQG